MRILLIDFACIIDFMSGTSRRKSTDAHDPLQ